LDAKSRKQAELAISFVLKKYPEDVLRRAFEDIDIGLMGGKDTAERLVLADACFLPANVKAIQAL